MRKCDRLNGEVDGRWRQGKRKQSCEYAALDFGVVCFKVSE